MCVYYKITVRNVVCNPTPARLMFCLLNVSSRRKLDVYMSGQRLKSDPRPACLGWTLDRTLYTGSTCEVVNLVPRSSLAAVNIKAESFREA